MEIGPQGKDEPSEARMDPRLLLQKIEFFTEEVGNSFKGILGSLTRLQEDIRQLDQLKEVAQVAEAMLSGGHRTHLEVEAKGEVGKLVFAINQTLDNLQQLDKTVHEETGKVPELAQHLDAITEETEAVTAQVLEKLDAMIAGAETQTQGLHAILDLSKQRLQMDRESKQAIDQFLEALSNTEDHEAILQEALEFVALMGQHATSHLAKSEEIDTIITEWSAVAEELTNHAFDIMNMLQFQDITRQKISKVIGLLKEMQSGLYRLLEIFNIRAVETDALVLTGKHRATQDRILERSALGGDRAQSELDVESIIRGFKNN